MKFKKNEKRKPWKKLFPLLALSIFTCGISKVATAQKRSPWVAPAAASNVKNPLAGNTDILKYAKVIYSTYCGPCHGNNGKGDGIAAPGLPVKPADHTSDQVQDQTDGALYWMITTGRTPMPSYSTTLTETQRWEMVNYIRTLAKHKK